MITLKIVGTFVCVCHLFLSSIGMIYGNGQGAKLINAGFFSGTIVSIIAIWA